KKYIILAVSFLTECGDSTTAAAKTLSTRAFRFNWLRILLRCLFVRRLSLHLEGCGLRIHGRSCLASLPSLKSMRAPLHTSRRCQTLRNTSKDNRNADVKLPRTPCCVNSLSDFSSSPTHRKKKTKFLPI